MTISSALHSALTGLQTSSLRAGIAASNVANASTPGYVRRAADLGETITGGESNGVHSNGVVRAADARLTASRRDTSSDLAQIETLANTWKTLSARIGDTASGDGLFAAFARFESALNTAQQTPESLAAQTRVLDAAKSITTTFHALSEHVRAARTQADAQIAQGVETVNTGLKEIETLNRKLAGLDRRTNEAAALFDERQRVLDRIAEYMPIQTIDRDSGAIDVLTQEGVFLLASKARPIAFAPAGAFGPNETLLSGDLSGLSVDGTDLTPGAAAFGAISSGRFSALFALRDQQLPDVSEQLDALAGDLIQRLSDDTIDPTTPAGADGLLRDPLPGGGAGLAARIAVHAAVDPAQGGAVWRLRDGLGAATSGPPGNASILTALKRAFTDVQTIAAPGFDGALSATERTAQLVSLTGQKRLQFETVLTSVRVQHGALAQAEATETGVNIDTEMQALLEIEQAYAANARIIQVAGDMLNRLMEI